MTTQCSSDSNSSMEVNSTASSSQASTPNSQQGHQDQTKNKGFFNFGSTTSSENSMIVRTDSDPINDDPATKSHVKNEPSRITAGTIAEALKQLQLLEEKEEKERLAARRPSTEKSPAAPQRPQIMLMRFIENSQEENNDNLQSRRKFKNLNKLTLSTTTPAFQTDDNEVAEENQTSDNKPVELTPSEMTPALLALCRERELMLCDILRQIYQLRDMQLVEMSYRVRQRALQAKFPAYVMRDFPSLYGRCFNLSMNMKILSQCQFADSSIAARVLSDFDILEKSLEAKLPPQADISSLLEQIKI